MDEDEQHVQRGKTNIVDQVTQKPEEEDSSSIDADIDTIIIEEHHQFLKLYALEADKLVSTQKIRKSSNVPIEDEEVSTADKTIRGHAEIMLYTRQVLEYFRILKACSSVDTDFLAAEYTISLYILRPSVQHFINLTRFEGFPKYPF